MSSRLTIKKKEDFLWVTTTGTRSFKTVVDISADVLKACAEEKVKKVLVDVRALEGALDTLEAYEIPDKYFPTIRDPNVITRAAIVDLKESEDRYRFFETVAQNRGFNLFIFSNPEEAVEWLKK